jgi:succinate-acetate transporter protein
MEFKKGNSFGATAFTSYGLFWLTLVAIWILPGTGLKPATGPDSLAMGWYLFMWGVFTAFMFIGTLKLSRILQFVFLSLTVLFMLLAAGNWLKSDAHASHLLHAIAGWEGIICGLSAIYAAAAGVLNDVYKRNVLPV